MYKSNAFIRAVYQGRFPVLLIRLWDIEPAKVDDCLENITLFIYLSAYKNEERG